MAGFSDARIVLRTGALTCVTFRNLFILVIRGTAPADVDAAFEQQAAFIESRRVMAKAVLIDASVPSKIGARQRAGEGRPDFDPFLLCSATAVIGAGFAASAGLAVASGMIRLRQRRDGPPRMLGRSTREVGVFLATHARSASAPEYEHALNRALALSAEGTALTS